jgi:hypothetical protein
LLEIKGVSYFGFYFRIVIMDGLMGGADSSVSGESAFPETPPSKKACRSKLWAYDHATHQLLNDKGDSGIETVGLSPLWAGVCKGNSQVAFFSESADESSQHNRGIACSRNAETLQKSIEKLKHSDYVKIIDPVIYKKAMAEATMLLPHCVVLNGCDIPTESSGGVAAIRSGSTIVRDKAAVSASAAAMYTWLTQEESALRGLLGLLSGNGLFYVTQVHEKIGRAYLSEKNISVGEFASECKERLCGAKSSSTDDVGSLCD